MHILFIILGLAFAGAIFRVLARLEMRARTEGHRFLSGPPMALLLVLVVLGAISYMPGVPEGDALALWIVIGVSSLALFVWNVRKAGTRLGLLGSATQGVLLGAGLLPGGFLVVAILCLVVFIIAAGRRSVIVTRLS